VPGGAIRFTATYTNTGQTPYNNITIRTSAADLSDDFVGIGDQTASSGVISIDELTFESVWTGSIPVGGTVTLTGSGTVLDPDPGNRDIVTVVHTTA
ncbi:hypothetical protein, partial [Frankia sp. EI5c]|uniref:hypothetical protein n=1 Tax=Frankia sp. EI5c TaxID=683316 RepID=UPI001A7E354A